MKRGVLFLPLVFTGCLAVENALVYRPRPGQQPYAPPPAPLQDVTLKSADGSDIHARWAPHPSSPNIILFCHGNGGNVELWGGPVRDVQQNLDASVLIFDYPGYGHSSGQPSEAGFYAAAEAAYRWLVEEKRIPAEHVIIWGESIGGAVAIELATRVPHRALVLVRTFTSVPDVADDQVPILVSSSFMTNRFESLGRIGQCKQPVFIASGEYDRVVSPRHGQRLHAACTAPAEFCLLRGLDHYDALPAGFYHAAGRFLMGKAPLAR